MWGANDEARALRPNLSTFRDESPKVSEPRSAPLGLISDIIAPAALSQPRPKTVQEHIDELPMWADGTSLRSAPMTGIIGVNLVVVCVPVAQISGILAVVGVGVRRIHGLRRSNTRRGQHNNRGDDSALASVPPN